MEQENAKTTSGLIARIRNRFNRRFGIFLIFVAIATFLWFLQALKKDYTSIVEHPVRFINLPEDLVLTNELPKRLTMEVRGTGMSILKHNWDLSKSSIRIDYDRLSERINPNTRSFELDVPLRAFQSQISAQLDKLEINRITPDTLTLNFSSIVTKVVPVVADVELDLDKEYMLKGPIQMDPDSISLSGPSKLVDSINQVYTSPLKFRKLKESVNRNMGLVEPDEEITMSDARSAMTIEVEQFTEKTLRVPVIGINVPDSLDLKTFPARITITFRVVLSEFDQIEAEQFQATVDYGEIVAEQTALKVMLTRQPNYIDNIRISPETVDYILEK